VQVISLVRLPFGVRFVFGVAVISSIVIAQRMLIQK